MVSSSTISRGVGEATTRRHPPRSGAMAQPRSAARRAASLSKYTGPMGFAGCWKATSSASTMTWVSSVAISRRGSSLTSSRSSTYPIIPSLSASSTSSGYERTSRYAALCSASSPTCGPLPCVTTTWLSWASSAMALHAILTFRRWVSASNDSPGRRSALPPIAATTSMRFSSARMLSSGDCAPVP